jgi:hypothetical protein
MKTHLLLIPMLLLCACRTTAGTKEKAAVTKPYAAQADLLLRKRIGALSEPQDQVYDCTVTSANVDDVAAVKKLISEVPREPKDKDKDKDNGPIIRAYHFRATTPSIEYYAYEGSEQILLYRDHSTLEYPGLDKEHHPAAKALKNMADKHCPGPGK